ncbi:MAG: nucleoside deaminase [Bacilli bacterium]|nr:nucleoside deaminase [Bacilli bacterium]
MNIYIDAIIKEATKASKKKEVPIGAIVVRNNKIVSKAHNLRIKNNDVTSHAEIIAIKKAAKILKDWRLSDCDLYVTLEPCGMCMEVIKESRINNVYYLLTREKSKKAYYKTNVRLMTETDGKPIIEDYRNLLSNFFKLNCKR